MQYSGVLSRMLDAARSRVIFDTTNPPRIATNTKMTVDTLNTYNSQKKMKSLFRFFTIGKSDRSARSDRNKIQFLGIITIYNLNVSVM